jgi:hypothetical protein
MKNGWHTIQEASRFSANGAASFQPGATPQERRAVRDRGLKARANGRAVGSGFQPSWFWGHETQGVALGWYESGALPLQSGNPSPIVALDAESAEALGSIKAPL